MQSQEYREKILSYLSSGKKYRLDKLSTHLKLHPYTLGLAITREWKGTHYGAGFAFKQLIKEGAISTWKSGGRRINYVQMGTRDEVPSTHVKTGVQGRNEDSFKNTGVEKILETFLVAIARESGQSMTNKFKEKNDRIAELEAEIGKLKGQKEVGIMNKYLPWLKTDV